MAGSRAAHRYAKALLSLAGENGNLSQVSEEIRLIKNTIQDSKDLKIVLRSPIIKNELKRSALQAIFKDLSRETTNLFEVLIDNKRIALLEKVTQAFVAEVDRQNNITTATVTTAVPMTSSIEENILSKIKELTGSKEVELTQKVDEKLLGGFLLRYGDLEYDASIAGKLTHLRHRFKQNANA